MCGTCGCGETAEAKITNLQTGKEAHAHGHDGHGHDHSHGDHDHHHDHEHPHAQGQVDRTVALEQQILAKNDALAARNRAWFAGREILALNLVSSPGSGKTTLLERTIRELSADTSILVVEGDQATSNDGARIRAAGAPAVQVNTGTGCHLDAEMIARAMEELRPGFGAIVMIENVGNLVCPALFDLGESAKVAIFSVTEGEDKPLKYPHMFRAAQVMILNKTDLLPHLDFDVNKAIANARQVNPDILILQLSARTGDGFGAWLDWLRRAAVRMRASIFSGRSAGAPA